MRRCRGSLSLYSALRRSDATFFFPPSHPNVGALTSTNDGRSYRPRGLPNAYVMWKLVVRFENTRETFYQRKCREKTIDPDTCSCHRQNSISQSLPSRTVWSPHCTGMCTQYTTLQSQLLRLCERLLLSTVG